MRSLIVLLGVGLVGASACDRVYGDLGHNDPEVEECTGECVVLPSLGWEGPVLLWAGDPAAAEECPERAPNVVFEGYDGLSTVPQCPTCSCGPSACVLPGIVADLANMCTGAGNDLTLYPAPDGWNGSCVSNGVVTSADFDSIVFPPLSEVPCEPQAGDVTAQARYEWARLARACKATKPVTMCDETTICVPTSEPPPPGFSQCLFTKGEEYDCPAGYPERQFFYRDVDTTSVGCTECTCGPPEGGVCQATLRAFADTACSAQIGSSLVGLSGGGCSDPMAGVNLAGMDAMWLENQPGTCTPSGGEPFGEAVPSDPVTFCCQSQ